ncbi:MAG: DNA internalization-related competence protein ComEC/Rec2 [Ignavibacteriae bacterium]|nr:DNA internalization-related competence protein ComEC/Rec2 [Ignavibacteria bacterium]MBI3363437.1 DNA internalization-related competence protein ComEC/Rec2 [Ignavibacteriota bacterium]
MDAFRNRPAVKFCTPFMAGIVIGWYADVEWQAAFAFALLMLVAWQLFTLFRFPTLSVLASYLLIAAFGLLKIGYDAKNVQDNDIARCIVPGRMVEIDGIVSDLPRLTQYSLRWGLDVRKLTYQGKDYPVSGTVIVSVRRKDADTTLLDSISYGRMLSLRGELQSPAFARNPGEFDLRRYYSLNNIHALFIAGQFDSSAISAKTESNFIGRYVHPVRKSIAERLDRFIGGSEAEFLKGLLVGERSHIPQEVKTSFINAGVMHILAVSGLHVAIVAMMLLVCFQVFRLPEKLAMSMTMICLVYYTFLTGAAASVARSVIMAMVFLGAKLLERRSDMYNTMALSAIVILFIDAKQLFQPGFQLSFVAVFSLVYLYPKVYAALTASLPGYFKKSTTLTLILQALAVSLAAGIGTLPFTSLYFGKISLVSVLANIVIVPLSNIVLALGMLTVAISYLSSWVAAIYAQVTLSLTLCMVKAVGFFGSFPFAFVESHFTPWSSMVFYAGIGFLIGLTRSDIRKHMFISGLIAANVLLVWWIVSSCEPRKLRVTFLDVGQGDAAFIEFPEGNTMLVDGGPRTATIDAGERFILPFLRWKGIHRIDAIVISHPHSDHLGGIPAILRNMEIGKVYDAYSVARSSLYEEYVRVVDSLHLQRDTLRAGKLLAIEPGIQAYILHPTKEFIEARQVNLNNQSGVIRIVYGQSSLLLSGDAEVDAEASIRNQYGSFIRSNLLKVGHHGSITSTTVDFLTAVHPSLGIISVGIKNKFHHPSPAIVKRLSESGAQCFRTDELGAVVLESDGRSWSVVDWH